MTDEAFDAAMEAAIRQGAVNALWNQADALAARARLGTTPHDKFPGVIVRTSEAAVLARNSAQFGHIADAIEAGL